MTHRRSFLKTASLAALSAPFMAYNTSITPTLEALNRSYEDPEDYWAMVRKQFLLKEGQILISTIQKI